MKITQKLAALLICKLQNQIISIVPFTNEILSLTRSTNDDVLCSHKRDKFIPYSINLHLF